MSDNLTELEENILDAVRRNYVGAFDTKQFVKELRQIMPPTCTPTERKFLDRVREIGILVNSTREKSKVTILLEASRVYDEDFPDIDLKELVR